MKVSIGPLNLPGCSGIISRRGREISGGVVSVKRLDVANGLNRIEARWRGVWGDVGQSGVPHIDNDAGMVPPFLFGSCEYLG